MAQVISDGIVIRSCPARRGLARHTALLALLAAAALLVAACGSSNPGGSSAPGGSAATGSPPAAPSSPTGSPGSGGPAAGATPLPAGAFTFTLPSGWREVPVPGSHEALLASMRERNPAFADSLAARLGALAASTTYVAFDATPSVVQAGDLVTLVVTEVELPLDVSLETFAKTIQGQVAQLVEKDVQLDPVLLTAGRGYSLAYLAPITRPDGQTGSSAVTQVLYVLPGRGYVMTFAVPPARASDFSQAIADIATSFMIRP